MTVHPLSIYRRLRKHRCSCMTAVLRMRHAHDQLVLSIQRSESPEVWRLLRANFAYASQLVVERHAVYREMQAQAFRF